MSDIIEHRMEYLPLCIAEDHTNVSEYATTVGGNMVLVHEKTWAALKADQLMPAFIAGHLILIKDPAGPADRHLSELDAMYPDEHGSSRKYFDTIDEAIGYAAQLRSLVRLSTGKFMQVAVLDFGDSDLIGELRTLGYAPKASE